MSGFCVVEGVDGSGKSHLVQAIRAYVSDHAIPAATVLVKDGLAVSDGSWVRDRIATMHALTWSYNHAEPVWEYSRRYWLHTLCAWFELVHQHLIAPELSRGHLVVIDGWYFKHYARLLLAEDPAVAVEAAAAFAALPQPDLIAVLDTPLPQIADRKARIKPSERGAFDASSPTGSGDPAPGGELESGAQAAFTGYQGRTATELDHILADRADVLRLADSGISPQDLLELITGRLRMST
jgi:thymidylate kinase